MKASVGYKEIYERYKKSILRGTMVPGAKVASIRALASELGVAKRTVESAYDILIGEGYLVSHGAKGTYVSPDLGARSQQLTSKKHLEKPSTQEVPELNKGAFRLGVPAFDAFPEILWKRISSKAIKSMSKEDLDHPGFHGYWPLRIAIASYLGISRGVFCSAEQVFITGGYNESINLILRILHHNGGKFVMEEPGYFMAHRILKQNAIEFDLAPVGTEGMNVSEFLAKHSNAKIVLTTPTHQSPLSHVMSLPNRCRLLEWAEKKNAWIIEDDYDGEFHYTKKQIPALKSLDNADRVIYVGTFSKSILPAVRIGYVVVPKSIQDLFFEKAQTLGSGQPVIIQKILHSFLSDGHFYRHLKKMRAIYEKRRRFVLDAIEKVFPDKFSFDCGEGGLHLVAYLNRDKDDISLARRWQQNGLPVISLSEWYQGKEKRRGLVIGFANVQSEKEAVRLLSRL